MDPNIYYFLISQNISADLKGPKVKYKLHCTTKLWMSNEKNRIEYHLLLSYTILVKANTCAQNREANTFYTFTHNKIYVFYVNSSKSHAK